MIAPENVRVLTDSECCQIWSRVLRSRFKIGVQTLITKGPSRKEIAKRVTSCIFQLIPSLLTLIMTYSRVTS